MGEYDHHARPVVAPRFVLTIANVTTAKTVVVVVSVSMVDDATTARIVVVKVVSLTYMIVAGVRSA